MAFEDVLSGLPTSEQPYDHELRRGPSRARCSRFPASPCLHRSDRSAKLVRPVRPGFRGCWSFWRSFAHSSAFECVGAILCQHYLFISSFRGLPPLLSFTILAMALDSVPTYLSDLGSSHRAARTQQQRIRYAEAQLPQVSPAAKFARISVSWCLFFNFCSVKKHQERWAHLDLGHLRSVWRRAPVEEVRREEALQLQLPKVHNPSCLQFPFHAFCSLKKRFFSFSPSMHPLCVQELLLLLSRYSCRKWSIQLLLDLEWICGTYCCVNWRVITWNIWILGTPLPCFDWKYSWFLIDLASSNINKGDSYMLPIYFLNVASRPHHVIKLQFLHYLK